MPGKKLPQTMNEMVEDGVQQRKRSKLYKAESAAFVNSQLSALINRTTRELADISSTPPFFAGSHLPLSCTWQFSSPSLPLPESNYKSESVHEPPQPYGWPPLPALCA